MLKLALIAVATAAAAAPAFAGTRLTDTQFIQAGRCQGLISSQALGPADAAAINAFMKSERGAHPQVIIDKADEARRDAERSAKRAGDERRTTLIAERDGACQAFGGPSGATTAAGAAAPTTN
jgi:hypothetical protein